MITQPKQRTVRCSGTTRARIEEGICDEVRIPLLCSTKGKHFEPNLLLR